MLFLVIVFGWHEQSAPKYLLHHLSSRLYPQKSIRHVSPPSISQSSQLGQALKHQPHLVDLFEQHKNHKTLRSEEHTSELQSRPHLVCRLLLEKKNRTVNME